MKKSELPELCYVEPIEIEYLGIVKRGEKGYYLTDFKKWPGAADEMNKKMGVTKPQAKAMLHGSLFGWHVPAANPSHPVNHLEDK